MTPTREELLAQIAETEIERGEGLRVLQAADDRLDKLHAKLAALAAKEAEPDWPLALRQMAYVWGSVAAGADQSAIAPKFKAMCHELADTFPALPLAPAEPVDDATFAALFDKVMWEYRGCTPGKMVEAAIRRTLAHRGARWPTDAELEMLALGSAWPDRTPEETALEMARRLKARMGAGGGAKAGPYIVYADDEGWFDWHGGECPVPAGTRVEVRYRNGRTDCGLVGVQPTPIDSHAWSNDNNKWDVVAYRILSGEEA